MLQTSIKALTYKSLSLSLCTHLLDSFPLPIGPARHSALFSLISINSTNVSVISGIQLSCLLWVSFEWNTWNYLLPQWESCHLNENKWDTDQTGTTRASTCVYNFPERGTPGQVCRARVYSHCPEKDLKAKLGKNPAICRGAGELLVACLQLGRLWRVAFTGVQCHLFHWLILYGLLPCLFHFLFQIK